MAATGPAPATGGEPFFTSVGIGSIPRGVVAGLAQERSGLLWIGTGDGVVSFDGYRFRARELDHPDPVRRNLGWVRAMLGTRDGRVWIGTENAGVVSYEPQSDRISALPELGGDRKPRPSVMALAEAPDGAIWVAWLAAGLDRLSPDRAQVSSFRQAGNGRALPDDRVQALLVDRQGQVWAGSFTGLSRLRPGGERFEPVATGGAPGEPVGLGGRSVQALLQAADGRIWVGTGQGDVFILDPDSGQVLQQAGPPLPEAAPVTALVQPPDGPVWVARSSGIDWFDADSGAWLRRVRQQSPGPGGLIADEVMAMLVDQNGWVWVGGLGLGLQGHNPRYNGLSLRRADTATGGAWADADTRGLLQLDHGEIWVATRRQGVLVMNPALEVTGAVPLGPAPGVHATGSGVLYMAQTRDGSVWAAGDGRLHRLDRDRRLLHSRELAVGVVNQLVAAQDGGLWICSQFGLYRLAPGAEEPVRVPVAAPSASGDAASGNDPSGPVVFVAGEAADGSLWVGTLGGLYRLPAGGSALLPVAARPGAELGSHAVIGLLLDSRQQLWVDTAIAGLHKMVAWDGEVAAFDAISRRHGRVGPPFGVNLLEDDQGRIWTQQHVYDPAADHLHALGSAEGAHLGTGWFGAYVRLADGRLLFGGSQAMLVVQPQHFRPVDEVRPLLATELHVNGMPRPLADWRNGLALQPQDRSFAVEFARLEFAEPHRIRYAWRLDGFDTGWNEAHADHRRASYSNLAPGHYRLQVRATHTSGRWAEPMLELPVQVLPAWWQQWWARGALAVLALLSVLTLVQWRTRQLRLRQAELRQAVQERTASLEAMAQALQRNAQALQEASLTDPLTGLRNRRSLMGHILDDSALSIRKHEDHRRHGTPLPPDADLVFFLIDIDHFKQINDNLGHAAGDAVLLQIRNRLEKVFRDTDAIVRWGGEEFLVVARGMNRRDAAELATRALQGLSALPFVLQGGPELVCTSSLGFACFPLASRWPRALDWADAVALADAALYAAKQEGRARWVGVVDEGSLDEQALLTRRPLADWLLPGGATVRRAVMAAPPG